MPAISQNNDGAFPPPGKSARGEATRNVSMFSRPSGHFSWKMIIFAHDKGKGAGRPTQHTISTMPSTNPQLELQRQRLLLEIEYNCEKEAYRRQTETMGLARQVKRGDAWYPIRVARSYYNSLNQLSVELFRTDDEEITHNFEYGRPVCLFRVEESNGKSAIHYAQQPGVVSYVDGDRMVITLPDNTRGGCERDATMANHFIEEDYHQSEHTRFYIGEWHTHPEENPTPSAIDYSSIVDIYQTASLVVSFLFMIIVGTESFHISIYNGDKFVKIEPKVV